MIPKEHSPLKRIKIDDIINNEDNRSELTREMLDRYSNVEIYLLHAFLSTF